MELRLYDTLTKEKREFVPLNRDNVRMYVCGPTVYDFAHIGNARPVIVFDVLFRLLRHLYGEKHVTYVRNITDVDDKINDRAARDFPGLPLNEAIRKVTEQTANQFHADVAALGCLPPTFEPRATDFVLPRADGKADMVTLIKELIARGHAYEAGGEVLFDVQSMPDYGALSGRRLDEQLAGARVAVDAHKKNPADFVLWKQSTDNEPGWASPWGRGRPGWHIECSAMSAAYLGNIFDIHGGGLDLIFPHHENEIAQSRCAHGTPTMANYWMHNGFLQVEGEKMSKSLGNFFTIRELLDDWPGDALRLNMLKTHYRSPIDWTLKSLEESKKVVDSWYDIVDGQAAGEPDEGILSLLGDDLNTSGAITRLHAIAAGRMATSEQAQLDIQQTLKASANVLGLLGKTKAEYLRGDPRAVVVDDNVVRALIADRTAARARKDFKESDRIRDELAAMGVVIKDSKEGTTWEIAR
ncbi:cysteine--tRNA ligase [Bradyrhizobium erythrophlei]|uniref:Cysteine--tRNA ligase n=1 Tax=Bradyrhizobium erythrophlei TaxID=1437360 RepID=A0A1M7SRT6_9BRAD|nr:cysteine--tRNA ligase [Bradyrhizobium erythrophlei]SHN61189.1 cysteinyl-tRNA synthetase [Bradyrhizobium erythrophlei]